MPSTPPPFTSYETITPAVERSFFNKTFLWMFGALLVTAVTSLLVASTSLAITILSNPYLLWGSLIAELVMVIVLSARINKMSFTTAAIMMIAYSILNGITLSFIFLAYKLGSIASTFFITAGMFGAMALIGANTKKNLQPAYRYLIMAVIGLVIALVVNAFMKSSGFDYIISIAGVLIFTVLTAVDTQKIKLLLREGTANGADQETLNKIALMGSLELYLDFINLFLYLLRIFASRD